MQEALWYLIRTRSVRLPVVTDQEVSPRSPPFEIRTVKKKRLFGLLGTYEVKERVPFPTQSSKGSASSQHTDTKPVLDSLTQPVAPSNGQHLSLSPSIATGSPKMNTLAHQAPPPPQSIPSQPQVLKDSKPMASVPPPTRKPKAVPAFRNAASEVTVRRIILRALAFPSFALFSGRREGLSASLRGQGGSHSLPPLQFCLRKSHPGSS